MLIVLEAFTVSDILTLVNTRSMIVDESSAPWICEMMCDIYLRSYNPPLLPTGHKSRHTHELLYTHDASHLHLLSVTLSSHPEERWSQDSDLGSDGLFYSPVDCSVLYRDSACTRPHPLMGREKVLFLIDWHAKSTAFKSLLMMFSSYIIIYIMSYMLY